VQRAAGHPPQRLEDDGQHGGLQTEEQSRHRRQIAEQHVEPRQRQDGSRARQDEQQSGHQAAAHAVQEPAGVGGQLLGFGAGQQHAVVEGVEEARLVEPALLVDDDAVQQGDLGRWSAKAEQPHPPPDGDGFAERDGTIDGADHRRPAACSAAR
jgi:hypothetical protein